MEHQGTNSTTPLDTHSTSGPSGGSAHQSSQALPPPSTPPQESPALSNGWKIIDEQDFSDELDFLSPSYNLRSGELRNRKEDDVVIFHYSLSRGNGKLPVEEGGPSSEHPSGDDDVFFLVSKDRLTESEQFNQIINPTKDHRLIQSRGSRLAIM